MARGSEDFVQALLRLLSAAGLHGHHQMEGGALELAGKAEGHPFFDVHRQGWPSFAMDWTEDLLLSPALRAKLHAVVREHGLNGDQW